jgi:ribonuclease HI
MPSGELRTPQAIIYADGACLKNPGGPGGTGTVILPQGGSRREISRGYRSTTNNRMELRAAIEGLTILKEPTKVTLYSDSRYLVDGMDKGWARNWRRRGWVLANRAPAKNPDLWARLLDLCERHEVRFIWVQGHAGNDENERCDELADAAARGMHLEPDVVVTALQVPGEPPEQVPFSRPRNKAKMTEAGQPCRHCGTPVVLRTPKRLLKPGQTSYFEHYLYCPKCRAQYNLESSKRWVTPMGQSDTLESASLS